MGKMKNNLTPKTDHQKTQINARMRIDEDWNLFKKQFDP